MKRRQERCLQGSKVLPQTRSASYKIRGAPRYQIRSFLNIVQKGGGGHFHVQKFWSKFCLILKAFWQHKIDIKRLFKGRNVSNCG